MRKKHPPAAPGTGFAGEEKKRGPARVMRAGAPFFCAAKQKNLREKKGIFRGRPFAPGRGAWSFWRAKGAVAGCALPKGRGKKPGAPRRGGGPHRPGGADCPAGPGAGGPAEKGAGGGEGRAGEGVPQQGKRPRPRGSAPQGRGGGAGRGAGEAGGRETGRKGGGAGPKPCRGFGERAEGGALASSAGEKLCKGGRVREKAPRGGQRPCPPAGGGKQKKEGPRCAGRAPGPLLPHGPKGGARRGKRGGVRESGRSAHKAAAAPRRRGCPRRGRGPGTGAAPARAGRRRRTPGTGAFG